MNVLKIEVPDEEIIVVDIDRVEAVDLYVYTQTHWTLVFLLSSGANLTAQIPNNMISQVLKTIEEKIHDRSVYEVLDAHTN